MSSDIWTQCAGRSEVRPLKLTPWRVVESQHQVSTRKLVDTLEEQALLEELIDSAKPRDTTNGRLHYLLSTPFRYPPLPYGSRFGAVANAASGTAQRTSRPRWRRWRITGCSSLTAPRRRWTTSPSSSRRFALSARTKRGVDLVAPHSRRTVA
jgi:hypothetical protein